MMKAGRMLRARLDNILAYLKHRVANAASEAIDSRIQWVKATARGFRNRQNFIDALYFHRGGLDLEPASLPTENPEEPIFSRPGLRSWLSRRMRTVSRPTRGTDRR